MVLIELTQLTHPPSRVDQRNWYYSVGEDSPQVMETPLKDSEPPSEDTAEDPKKPSRNQKKKKKNKAQRKRAAALRDSPSITGTPSDSEESHEKQAHLQQYNDKLEETASLSKIRPWGPLQIPNARANQVSDESIYQRNLPDYDRQLAQIKNDLEEADSNQGLHTIIESLKESDVESLTNKLHPSVDNNLPEIKDIERKYENIFNDIGYEIFQPFTLEEIGKLIASTKASAPGPDGITIAKVRQ
ncbi:hypothetical protein ILUMI_09713 [Ignelater luminosus]|uniref:Uncharacterized protein n=1 Tax=Ignelater luminosus TaxID=2038154 RepID=A0A8K0GE98_IGNLU|nr:hypothetical protein ILUMI_09713 [Ignelater luminosus]